MEAIKVNYYDVLMEFLSSKEALENFTRALDDERCNGVTQEGLKYLLNNTYLYKVLNVFESSFIWFRTPEGHEYWNDLSNEWKTYVVTYKPGV